MESGQQAVGSSPPSSTHLLAATDDVPAEYRGQDGVCCFCGVESEGVDVEVATSEKYFSDDPLLEQPTSDHVCFRCAWVMDQRTFKQGHWLVHADGVKSPSTGDLLATFRQLRSGEFDPPLAVHVTSSPIRSSHAYLWTPVNETAKPLTVAFDREKVRIGQWDTFEGLVAAVEDLRLHDFTFDEIKSGEPRVANLRKIGREGYWTRDRIIDPHRWTAWIELALTLSRGADDQPRDELTDHNPLTDGN